MKPRSVPERQPPRLGVVIPTLEEADHLPLLLADLERTELPLEILVVDGGSRDGTREVARDLGVDVVRAHRGRARQLNAGARVLDTPWLLFLHADSRVPPEAARALERWLRNADDGTAAYFGFRLDGRGWFWRFIEVGQMIRERLSGLAYGDQGLVVPTALFRRVGGFPDLPLMEDVAMIRRLRTVGRVQRIPEPIHTSPRRYVREGRWRGWIRNTVLITLHLAGVHPRVLARWYPSRDGGSQEASGDRRPGGGSGEERMVMVFAKAPEPGRVKTRLAAEIGDREAARLYRKIGRGVVEAVRGGSYRTVVYYDPPGALRSMKQWLGETLEYRPQVEGGLGRRMSAAFDEAFGEAAAVCVIGTDAPGVDRALVERAFRALDEGEPVLGPAEDGGYYLMALRKPVPELFRDIPWSGPGVLAATLVRARDLGMEPILLEILPDVDRVSDLERKFPEFLPSPLPGTHS